MDCFGSGVLAAMMGAKLDNSSGRVWFWLPDDLPIQEIHIEIEPGNIWLQRIRDICAVAMERWDGQVLVNMTDQGGNLDVPATFRTTEKLLMDLIDYPEEVECLTWEAHQCWNQAYQEINEVLQPVNPGYSDWSGIYNDQPTYMLQCDFSYRISSKMFAKFVLPELQASCKDLIASAPFDLIESITPPPEGDLTLAEARAVWPGKLFWSDINVACYELPHDKLKEEVLRRVDEAAVDGRMLAFEVSEQYPDNWKDSLSVVLEALEQTRR
jgi:hypothetical protein